MALIACRECGAKVSDKAASCPHCGCPITDSRSLAAVGDRLTTVQQTSKDLKAQVLWAYGLMVMGLLMAVMAPLWLRIHDQPWSGGDLLYGLGVVVLGVGWQIVTRIRIWWHHK